MNSMTLEKETISRLVDPTAEAPEPTAGYPISMPPWCHMFTPRSDAAAAHPGAEGAARRG